MMKTLPLTVPIGDIIYLRCYHSVRSGNSHGSSEYFHRTGSEVGHVLNDGNMFRLFHIRMEKLVNRLYELEGLELSSVALEVAELYFSVEQLKKEIDEASYNPLYEIPPYYEWTFTHETS